MTFFKSFGNVPGTQQEVLFTMRMRWFVLAGGIILGILGFLRGELWEAGISFCTGLAGGFALDLLGVEILKLWYYPRQPFPSKLYFLITLPSWGVFGAAVNLTWNSMGSMSLFVSSTTIIIGLLLFHEVPNLKTKSWVYRTPSWVVILGWIPLITFFRMLYVFLT